MYSWTLTGRAGSEMSQVSTGRFGASSVVNR
jgi:hypothetical protein